jgi:outer membrane protein assembly factor BamB
MNTSSAACLVALALLSPAMAAADAPFGWRGDGTGVFAEADPPVTWSPEEQVVWRTALPRWSNASPAIGGDRIFVCGEPDTLICLSLADGNILWQRETTWADVPPGADGKATPMTWPKTEADCGYTSPTPVTDGRRVYVLFGSGLIAGFDVTGNRLWTTRVDASTSREDRGHSASPLLVGDKLIVHLNNVFAFDAATGRKLWETPSTPRWGTPVACRVGADEVVVDANGNILRVDDGKLLAANLCPLDYNGPLAAGHVVYMIQHNGKAIRLPDRIGEPFATETLWTTRPRDDRYYAVPVAADGLLYVASQRPQMHIIEQATGSVIYTNRLALGDGRAYSSMTLAGKYLYVGHDSGKMVVMETGRDPKPVATNRLERFRSTPVFQGTRMYLRTLDALYCIGQ